MISPYFEEIRENLGRAGQSVHAAKELAGNGYYDFAGSRAYYAAFYGATALLLAEGIGFSKHSGVISSIHKHFVRTEKLSEEQGKNLSWLSELRSI